MSTSHTVARPKSVSPGARPPTPAERADMMRVVARLDSATSEKDFAAVGQLFASNAVSEIKPLGVRIEALDTIIEMFRRTLPELAEAAAAREQKQIWINQNGVVREWLYPVRLRSGEEVRSRQLEIIEFTRNLSAIASYRLRMNLLYAKLFERALGADFAALPGVRSVPR